MLPSLLDTLERNWNHRATGAAVFEIGMIYIPGENELPDEIPGRAAGQYGDIDFYDLKGVVEALFDNIRLKNYNIISCNDNPSYHPGRCAEILFNSEKIGVFGQIHPLVAEEYGIKTAVFAAEINLDKVFSLRGAAPVYKELPKYPAVTRDLALICGADAESASIESKIRLAAGSLLENIELFDVYTGNQLAAGKKSLAYSLAFRSPNQTLNDEIIDGTIKTILETLGETGVTLRV